MIGLDTNVLVRCGTQASARFASGGADVADALIERQAAAAGCEAAFTFDAGAVESAGMKAVP